MNRSHLVIAACAAVVALSHSAQAQQAKNVILMIADGGGSNVYKATGYYEGKFGAQVYNDPSFISTHASNHPLRFGTTPIPGAIGLAQDPNTVYDPAKAYNTTPVGTTTGGYQDHFAGYNFHKTTYPDSANTIVSMMTGQKTYNNAVNVDGNGNPLPTFTQAAKNAGKSIGIVSTVQWADATPSVAGGAVNISRGNRTAIANQMLSSGNLDVIMGAGNPDFDNDGVARTTPNYSWVAPTDWADLKDNNSVGLSNQWQLAQNKSDFEALAADSYSLAPGKKFLGTFKGFDAHQSYRSGTRGGVVRPGPNPTQASGFASGDGQQDTVAVGTDPMRSDVPSLPTMAQGALNLLDNDSDGMYLMVEAGGVDRAMHANSSARMIEEMIEFNQTVEAVNSYLSANGGAGTNGNNFSNTLLIITGDHDHLVTGVNGDTNPFDPIQNNGAGNMPGTLWQFGSHSNFTIPLFAKGPGSGAFLSLADQLDQHNANGVTYGNGAYIDQTEIYSVLSASVPEPGSLLGLAGMGLFALRRRSR